MHVRRVIASALLVLLLSAIGDAQARFTLKVYTGRGQTGYDVNSTLIIGERDILLIDRSSRSAKRTSSPRRSLKRRRIWQRSTPHTPTPTICSGWPS